MDSSKVSSVSYSPHIKCSSFAIFSFLSFQKSVYPLASVSSVIVAAKIALPLLAGSYIISTMLIRKEATAVVRHSHAYYQLLNTISNVSFMWANIACFFLCCDKYTVPINPIFMFAPSGMALWSIIEKTMNSWNSQGCDGFKDKLMILFTALIRLTLFVLLLIVTFFLGVGFLRC